jgi:hypothetical protein
MRNNWLKWVGLVAVLLCRFATPAFADADDAAWIKQCVADNGDEKAKATVVAAYCACMNNKMASNENSSISVWEKSHPAERAACDKESGWK